VVSTPARLFDAIFWLPCLGSCGGLSTYSIECENCKLSS
jgi:hypothetical protein